MRVLTIMVAAVSAMLAACGDEPQPRRVAGGDIDTGRRLVEQYQCASCHVIPGAAGASSRAGPALAGFGKRSYIAGRIPNTPDGLIAWLIDPPARKPGTMMPDLGVSETEARHMAAFLYTLQ